MENCKIQTLPGFEGCEVDIPKVENPPFKYLEIEVTRTQSSIVFVKVPYNIDMTKLRRGSGTDSIISKACAQTLQESDWDSYGWKHDVEVQSIKEVTEEEATAYEVYVVNYPRP